MRGLHDLSLRGSHWLERSQQWASGVSSMSQRVDSAAANRGHSAMQMLDGRSSSWWLVGTYPNQWVTFDLKVDTTLSMVRVQKAKGHEGCKVQGRRNAGTGRLSGDMGGAGGVE